MYTLNAEQVAKILPEVDCLAAMRGLFLSLSKGEVAQPPQTLTQLPGDAKGGDFITYLAALADPPVFGAKLSPYLPMQSGPKVTAWTLLMSSIDGSPLMLCDAMALTVERTAATTALAVDLLAPPGGGKLALIGSGPIGVAHLRQTKRLRKWREICCWSPRIASRAEVLFAEEPGVVISASCAEATKGADVVLLCTSSAMPVLDPRTLENCSLLTSITTNAPGAHEIPPESLKSLDVYCDFALTTPGVATEMRLAAEAGWSADQILGDLSALVAGTAPMPSRAAYFRSVGLGSEDIAIAAALHSILKAGRTA
jgi:L-arginine dehydrogenase